MWPTPVQGDDAPNLIIEAIKGFNSKNYLIKPDVIIIARGGGSTEDLMAFNDEKLAIEVFKSNIPIVSAIGHETDTTIIDFVSDLRAATPSSAAEIVVPVRADLIQKINICSERLSNSIAIKVNYSIDFFSNLARLLKDPQFIIDQYREKFLFFTRDLTKSFDFLIEKKNISLRNYFMKLKLLYFQ